MKTSGIIALADFVKGLCADGAHLYLWVTNNRIPEGLDVLSAWGFRYISILTWVKNVAGLGQYFRNNTEHLLFGVRGETLFKDPIGPNRNRVPYDIQTGFYANRAQHSVKPAEARRIIEAVSFPPRIELFARREVPGWDLWGYGVDGGVREKEKETTTPLLPEVV
jgi:N6-adenosine-specific RNA methylase IME4